MLACTACHYIRSEDCVHYRALLAQMAPEHKFATAAKLCQDILGGFADNSLRLNDASEVLRDSLTILASKEIKASPHPFGT